MMMSSRRYLKINFVRIMQRTLLPSEPIRPYRGEVEYEEQREKAMAPQDVKEGYFAVFAVKCEKPKRFVVELGYLRNPAFLKLLDQAEEEYGFQHEGALTVPCSPEELQKILTTEPSSAVIS